MNVTKNDPKLGRYFGSTERIMPWLGIVNLFQTFEEALRRYKRRVDACTSRRSKGTFAAIRSRATASGASATLPNPATKI
jgi:hypothetical protein